MKRLLVSALLLFYATAALAAGSEYYQSYSDNTPHTITSFGGAQFTVQSTVNYFIPNKTQAEWDAFYALASGSLLTGLTIVAGNFDQSGFETTNDGWTLTGSAQVLTQGHSGAKSMGVDYNYIISEGQLGNTGSISKTLDTKAGTMSFWALVTDAAYLTLKIDGVDSGLVMPQDGTWHYYTTAVTGGSHTYLFEGSDLGDQGLNFVGYFALVDEISIPIRVCDWAPFSALSPSTHCNVSYTEFDYPTCNAALEFTLWGQDTHGDWCDSTQTYIDGAVDLNWAYRCMCN